MRLLWDGGLKTGRTKKSGGGSRGDYLCGSDCSHKLPSRNCGIFRTQMLTTAYNLESGGSESRAWLGALLNLR